MLELLDLENSNRVELDSRWKNHFKSRPPKGISHDLMHRILAYDAQAKIHGDIDAKTRRALKIKKEKRSGARPHQKNPKLKIGSRLIREWNGDTHSVDVTPAGFEWRGKSYRSLSAIAKAITGAHWSGPRFFGLNNEATRHG